MWTLHCDVYFSRRLRLHHVTDETGDPVWSGKELLDALEFLLEAAHPEFRVVSQSEERCYSAIIGRL